MNANAQQVIQQHINKLKNLPALPEASIKILDAINDPNISIDKLAEVLSLSPALLARLLGLANSAYFGQSRQINNLSAAIYQVLGLDLVKSLSLGIVLNVHLDTGKCQAFNSRYFWMRSLTTAFAAQKLASAQKPQLFPPAIIYTSGLLLYIGILVMAYLYPEDLQSVLLRAQSQRLAVSEEILRKFGQSHFQLGHALLQSWGLSPVYQTVLSHYEDQVFLGEERSIIQVLRAGQVLSSMLLDDEIADLSELARVAEQSCLPVDSLAEVFAELVDNKQDMEKLALIMGI